MEQLSFWNVREAISDTPYIVNRFSADDFFDDTERRKLEEKYSSILTVTSK